MIRRGATRSRFGRAALRLLPAVCGAALLTTAIGTWWNVEPAEALGPPLTAGEVEQLVADAVAYSKRIRGKPEITVGVVDAEGNALAAFRMAGNGGDPALVQNATTVALAKAATGAYFSSDFGTFTTRTAAFIIQDHFPPGLRFAPGGPLYGVQFSSFATTDVNTLLYPSLLSDPNPGDPNRAEAVFLANPEHRVRGDLGGVAVYKGNKRVGGIGIAVDHTRKRLSLPKNTLPLHPSSNHSAGKERRNYRLTFSQLEKGRDLERIAHAAARGSLPSTAFRAGRITVDGIRLPYRKPVRLSKLRRSASISTPSDGEYVPGFEPRDAGSIASRFTELTLQPPPTAGADAQAFTGQMPIAFPPRASTDGGLTEDDVRRILWQGAQRANITRAAIRRPIGRAMECWISVVDTNGEVLGVLRFKDDATMFSFDVSVQKARTAMFFSQDGVAWSTRAIGQFSQAFFPAGQQHRDRGPMYQLQDGLTVGLLGQIFGDLPSGNPEIGKIRNGITIFPGGVPLYRNGVLVGGVGISGDGVDQDDIVADFASRGFGPPFNIRCDKVKNTALTPSLLRTLRRIRDAAPADPGPSGDLGPALASFFHSRLNRCITRTRTQQTPVEPPYVKHPRHPGPVTIR